MARLAIALAVIFATPCFPIAAVAPLLAAAVAPAINPALIDKAGSLVTLYVYQAA